MTYINRHRRYLFMIIVGIFIAAIAIAATSCGDGSAKRAENEERVIRAVSEYPGDGLYDPVVTVLGVDVPAPTEEEKKEAEEQAAAEKSAWEKAVGDCFAEGMFENFYDKWYRIHVVGIAYARNLTTEVTELSTEDDDASDNIEHVLTKITATDSSGKAQEFDMDWMVVFDKDDKSLIQRIELQDDGGFYESTSAQFDIGEGLTVTEDEENDTRTIETDYFTLTLGRASTWNYEQNDPGRISIYNTAAHDAGIGGHIMSIQAFDPEDESYDIIPNKVIGEKEGKKIVVTYASDVQYNINDNAQSDDYMTVRREAETIKEGGAEGPLRLK